MEMRSKFTGGPIVFTSILFCVRKRTLKKKGHPSRLILAEFFPRNVLFDGMGWDGMGNQKCPLIFFNLRYIKH